MYVKQTIVAAVSVFFTIEYTVLMSKIILNKSFGKCGEIKDYENKIILFLITESSIVLRNYDMLYSIFPDVMTGCN